MKVNLIINSMERATDIEPGEMLCDTLRKIGFTSVRKSCGTSVCGACTVLLDGEPVPSCSFLTAKAEGYNITTIEGVKDEAEKLAGLLVDEGAVQCGFCSPGFALTVISMKRNLTDATEENIRHYLVGNLCRCSGYQGQMRAVKKYMGVLE